MNSPANAQSGPIALDASSQLLLLLSRLTSDLESSVDKVCQEKGRAKDAAFRSQVKELLVMEYMPRLEEMLKPNITINGQTWRGRRADPDKTAPMDAALNSRVIQLQENLFTVMASVCRARTTEAEKLSNKVSEKLWELKQKDRERLKALECEDDDEDEDIKKWENAAVPDRKQTLQDAQTAFTDLAQLLFTIPHQIAKAHQAEQVAADLYKFAAKSQTAA